MPERAAAVLDAIATAPPGAVLFHCESGRDRTGLIALLLLAAADVEPEDIVTDYLASASSACPDGDVSDRTQSEDATDAACRRHGTTPKRPSGTRSPASTSMTSFSKRL
jgi:protein tyrosine/serine phosphatase